MDLIKQLVEWSAIGIELLTVALILAFAIFGTLRFVGRVNGQFGEAYEQYKMHLGKMLILALEFLVAADIIRTVALDQTLNNVAILGLLVLIRTFLSWSLSVEIEGRWPWSKGETKRRLEGAGK